MVVMVRLLLLLLLLLLTQARLGKTKVIPLVSLIRKKVLLWSRQVSWVVSLAWHQGKLSRRQSGQWRRLQQRQGTAGRQRRSRAVRLRVPG